MYSVAQPPHPFCVVFIFCHKISLILGVGPGPCGCCCTARGNPRHGQIFLIRNNSPVYGYSLSAVLQIRIESARSTCFWASWIRIRILILSSVIKSKYHWFMLFCNFFLTFYLWKMMSMLLQKALGRKKLVFFGVLKVITNGSGPDGSICQRHGSADLDPQQTVMDQQHWFWGNFFGLSGCNLKKWFIMNVNFIQDWPKARTRNQRPWHDSSAGVEPLRRPHAWTRPDEQHIWG